MVGVEGVAQAQRVGGQPDAGRERPRAEAEVVGDDEAEEQPEADDVQADDGRGEAAGARPLGRGEGTAYALQHGAASAVQAVHSPAIGKCVKRGLRPMASTTAARTRSSAAGGSAETAPQPSHRANSRGRPAGW